MLGDMNVMFKKGSGDWKEYRKLGSHFEIDFHPPDDGTLDGLSYRERMDNVTEVSRKALRRAYEAGDEYVIFRHGSSTSRPGATTSRSQVRKLMRDKEATPYIVRRECIQHDSVFVAAIRRKRATPGPKL